MFKESGFTIFFEKEFCKRPLFPDVVKPSEVLQHADIRMIMNSNVPIMLLQKTNKREKENLDEWAQRQKLKAAVRIKHSRPRRVN